MDNKNMEKNKSLKYSMFAILQYTEINQSNH